MTHNLVDHNQIPLLLAKSARNATPRLFVPSVAGAVSSISSRDPRLGSQDLCYGFTRRSINVPLSNFTLLISELTTEPWAVSEAIDNFRLEIPTTP